MYWPQLAREGTLLAGCNEDTRFDLTDPEDVGKFAAQAPIAFATQDEEDIIRWDKKYIKIASEPLTVGEIAQAMTGISGGSKQITAKFHSNQEIEQMQMQNPFVWSAAWQRDGVPWWISKR